MNFSFCEINDNVEVKIFLALPDTLRFFKKNNKHLIRLLFVLSVYL